MPEAADRRSELMARALDGGTDGPVDEQLSRELAMVSLLTAAGELARPDPAARDRMRQRILAGLAAENVAQVVATENVATENVVAVAAGDVAVGRPAAEVAAVVARDAGATELARRPAGGADPGLPAVASLARARRRRSAVAGLQGRLLVSAAASLCLLVTLSAMSLVLSRDALPGDALYGVKRSAESAELGLTFGDEPRGFKHLQFATARVDEMEALTARGETGDAGSFVSALQSFDTDAAAGSRLLIETATNADGDELAVLRGWAEQQQARLAEARTAMPDRAASRTNGSLDLLTRVADRASALQGRLACLAVTSGARDDLGLLPATGECVLAPGSGPLPGGMPTAGSRPNLTQPVGPPTLEQPNGQQPNEPLSPLNPLDPQQPQPSEPSEPGGPGGPGGPPGSGPGQDEPPTTPPAQTITIPLPLPLLPEITLPPLLPGLLPGLKLG